MPSLRERVLANFISQFVAESQNINSIMLFTTFLLVAKKTEQISEKEIKIITTWPSIRVSGIDTRFSGIRIGLKFTNFFSFVSPSNQTKHKIHSFIYIHDQVKISNAASKFNCLNQTRIIFSNL